MNTQSIHFRLIVWHMALSICVSLAFGTYTYFSLSRRLVGATQETLARRVAHIRDDNLPRLTANSPAEFARQIEDVYSPEESNRFIRITGSDGSLVYLSGTPKDHSFDPSSVPIIGGYTGQIATHEDKTGSSTDLLIVGLKSPLNGQDYVIEMGAPTNQIQDTLHKLIATLVIGLPVVVFIVIVGGLFLIRQSLRPVEKIRATAEKITFGNLRQRLPTLTTGDSIEHLSITLNQMLDRLEQTFLQTRRFSDDASHELRTPLTVLQSGLETLETSMRSSAITDPFRERISILLEETERLSSIVEGLLDLTRLDIGEDRSSPVSVDLAELAHLTLDQIQLLAVEKNLSVTILAPTPTYVMGDPSRLRQVIVNLLDNAIKYSTAGGKITLSVKALNGRAFLSVEDDGIGIAPEAQPHIFERFYRADKVRTRSTQGSGLGLSIVYSICQAHGGTVAVASHEGTGTTMTVELPLANRQSS